MTNENLRESVSENKGIGLLDLMTTVAEAWKALVIVPLIAGIVTAGVLLLLPAKYESRTLLRIGSQAPMVIAPNVLVPVMERLGLRPKLGGDAETALENLTKRIQYGPYQGSDVTIVSYQGDSPKEASQVLSEIISEVFKQSIPRDGTREDLELRLEGLRSAVSELQGFARRLTTNSATPGSGTEAEDYTRALALLVSDVQAKQQEIRGIERTLKGFGAEHIILAPTLPDRPVRMGRLPVVALVSVATGLLLTVFVILRSAYRTAQQDPEIAAKISRFWRAFRLRRPTNGA